MGVKRIVNLPTVSGWLGTAAGAFSAHTITIDIPVGPRYHAIWMHGNAGAAKKFTDLFGECRLKVNGKVQRVFTGLQLLNLNALMGASYVGNNGNVAATAFSVPLWLAEPWRKNLQAQEAMAWGTGNVSTFQLEVDILAYSGAAAGLTRPYFRAEIDNSLVVQGNQSVQQPLGAIVKWFQFQIPTASGWNDFMGFPKRDFYQSIHILDANLSEYEVKVDNTIVRQATVSDGYAYLKGREMDPQPSSSNHAPARTGYADIVFDHDDLLNSALPMQLGNQRVQDFNVRLNTTTAGASTAIIQLIGPAE